MDYEAIARAISDPENQPHQWTQLELAQFFTDAADEIENLRSTVKNLQHQRAEVEDARSRESARARIWLWNSYARRCQLLT